MRFIGIAVIALIGFASCQKEGANPSTVANTSAKANLTVGLPPVIMGWGTIPSIPYTDGIPNDVIYNNLYPQGFAINGKGYVCGSLLNTSRTGGVYIGDLWQWDPATRVWTKKSSCPASGGQLIQSINFVIGDNAYFVIDTITWQYNQPTDTWTQKSSVPSAHRLNGTGFAINGKGYMGLGVNTHAGGPNLVDLGDWWQYDPVADRWTKKGNFAGNPRSGAGGFAIDGKGYVVSGLHSVNGVNGWGKTVWQYDPTSDHWTEKANFPGTPRVQAITANATVGGVDVGFVVGGTSSSDGATDSWSYDPADDGWVRLPMGGGGTRSGAAGFVIGNSFYIANLTVSVLGWSR